MRCELEASRVAQSLEHIPLTLLSPFHEKQFILTPVSPAVLSIYVGCGMRGSLGRSLFSHAS